jgi:hypothetical protein
MLTPPSGTADGTLPSGWIEVDPGGDADIELVLK